MRFTSETGKHAKQIKQGKARARFWRALGFPNCAPARARRAELREERRVGYAEAELNAMDGMHDLWDPGVVGDTLPVGSGMGPTLRKRRWCWPALGTCEMS
jgi:hypothetical protein